MRFFDHYESLVIGRPRLTLVGVAIIALLLGMFIPRFQLDVSADSLVLENDAALDYYRSIRARYGSDDYLIVTYSPGAEMLSAPSVAVLREMTDRLRDIPRVASVTSILDVPLLQSPPLTIDALSDGAPTLRKGDADTILAAVELTSSPLYRNRLMSPDGRTSAVQVMLARDETYYQLLSQRDALRLAKPALDTHSADRVARRQAERAFDDYAKTLTAADAAVIERVRAVLDDYRENADLYLGGIPMIATDMRRFIRHDVVIFGAAVLGILAILLLAIFRQLRWVMLPMLIAATVGFMTLGALGLARWPVTVVSSNFMALVLIFSFSLTIHLIVRYRELESLQPGSDVRKLVSATLRSKIVPCLFTVLTTMVAFGSLVVSNIRPVIDFGWIMMFAMATSMFVAFSLFPSLLVMLPARAQVRGPDFIGPLLGRFARVAEHHTLGVIVMAVGILAISVAGISRLTVENRFIDYFHDETEIHQGMLLIDEQLGGTTPMDVIIDAPEVDPADLDWDDPLADDDDSDGGITATSYWFNASRLRDVRAIHDYLEGLPETGKVLSLATGLEVLQALEPDVADDNFSLSLLYKKLPDDLRAEMITPYLSGDAQQLRVALRVFETSRGLNRDALLEKIQSHLEETRGQYGERVQLTGMVVLYNNLLQSLFRSQIQTLAVIFLAIMLTFAILLRSLKVALIAIVPNIIPALFVLGLLGLLGVPLDIMTITIAAIAVGIGVDDTIHYVHRYEEEWRVDHDYRAALHRAHDSIGRAMYYTTMTITIGFLVMVLSSFIPTVYFGVFTAIAMVSALLTDITVLPMLFRVFQPYGPHREPDPENRSIGMS